MRWFELAAFVLAGLVPTPVGAQLAVDQAEIFLEPRALGRGIASINVSNEGDSVAEATIYLSDWDRREDGENRFYPSGTLPRSCGRLLRVFPLSVRLAPHTSQGVRVALDGADTLSAACWSIVFVESGAAPTGRGRQLAYITRLGVKIYGLPAGLAKDGMIDELVERGRRPGSGKSAADSGGQRFEVTFRNSGGLPLWVRGRVEFRRLDNSVAATADVPEFPLLPGARRTVVVPAPKLRAGRYVALALLDYGGADIAGAQTPFETP
ncbi:MAG: hypothetical protein DMD47_00290 [Gemmatimonadetes bacterium]|nr:MAG: hypothetical protein DMD47_00290 [Gemmatimonadota bacterium]